MPVAKTNGRESCEITMEFGESMMKTQLELATPEHSLPAAATRAKAKRACFLNFPESAVNSLLQGVYIHACTGVWVGVGGSG